ncbi:GNAT family N-acetyltransferase [Alkalihalophilus marmarensis]|jgi:ribosomal-protein-serine acetyltransferase|uniref:GNAT family N-acetyltransferase n=1 Tax=Alkalihalophilus marmarensis TaxID=521377 RepID=UPI00203B3AE5|nr:GNAT family protein [Alkalihalophilus marmarensis]MCM3490269.1 GNAT family N-acetyltransferase [Alkalihalophilus marmarensis]
MFYHYIREDLALKLVAVQDVEETFQLVDRNRAYLKEWLPWVDYSKTAEDTKSFVLANLKNYAEQKSLTTYIVYNKQIAGIVSFNTIDWNNKSVSIGYWIGQEFQGNGIVYDAVKALTNHAFHDLGLNRVEIRAAVQNEKSRAVAERLGFTQEGIVRETEWLYDHYVDHVIYSMLRRDWYSISKPETL